MNDFTQEIKRLQKLSCILLSPAEENKFGAQLSDIIQFLGKIPEIKATLGSKEIKDKLMLRTLREGEVPQDTQKDKLLKNVKHPIINNSIVIKSVLNG